MNAFQSGRTVEARALVRLLPFIEERADGGRYVRTDKGRMARFLQESVGDILFNREGSVFSIELKAEERHTGNLFLETWSNKNLEDAGSHAERGSNPGWLIKVKADLLFYYFLDTDQLYILSVLALKRWAFGYRDNPGKLHSAGWDGKPSYPEIRQAKYFQMNDTWGRLVPVAVLMRNLSPAPKLTTVRQLELLPEPL
jgi:hypothetical protein